MIYKKLGKRVIDIIISSIVIFILSPALLIIIIILIISNKGMPFFIQNRPGKNEKIINVIKFKTMSDELGSDGKPLPDIQRITRIGKFLRKTSLDELPQLFNVLIGDMSLVGPRPLLIQYIPLYSPQQKKRHDAVSGITGWAQVNGRNAISWAQKFEYDVWYVENLSFLLDIKILFLTVQNVIKRTGINQSSERPMLPFNGAN
jgi:undecaprenyl phosphate N,N'-diacetylbacillosamine 1-phosphate transferase